ncbi:MAG: ribose 5-phosphate isomerase A [Promethearchaeota archaeon]
MSVETAKKKAGYAAVDDHVKDGMLLGVGSGSTVAYVAERLGQLVKVEGWSVECVPTSYQSYQLCVEHGLPLTNLDEHPVLDLDIDGADEVDAALNLIKGGGGCLLQEKIVADASKEMVVVADYRKDSRKLGEKWKRGVPVEVVPLAHVPVMGKLESLGGKPVLRMAKAKAGPLVTDNGNFIVDVDFGEIEPARVASLHREMVLIPGVVETGFFVGRANVAYFGMEDGSVKVVRGDGRA